MKIMGKYERSLDLITDDEQILSGKAQIDYMNELESMCEAYDRVILPSEIARTVFSHRKYLEKFAYRRGFTIQFGIKENSFILDRVADSSLTKVVDEILKNHKEAVCQKIEKNKKGTTQLRDRKIIP